jgi:hypothetical protein
MLDSIHGWVNQQHSVLDILKTIAYTGYIAVQAFKKRKTIRAFITVPSQQVGVRWRKARLETLKGQLKALTRAKNDPLFRLQEIVSYIILIALSLALILLYEPLYLWMMLSHAHWVAPTALGSQTIHPTISDIVSLFSPFYMFALVLIGFNQFSKNLASFDERKTTLDTQIEKIEAKLGVVKV